MGLGNYCVVCCFLWEIGVVTVGIPANQRFFPVFSLLTGNFEPRLVSWSLGAQPKQLAYCYFWIILAISALAVWAGFMQWPSVEMLG